MNVGCIDTPGMSQGAADQWYREDAAGEVTLDIGVQSTNSAKAAAIGDLVASAAAGYLPMQTWEFTSVNDPGCVIGLGAAVASAHGAQIRVSVWRLTGAARTTWIPQHASLVVAAPDLLVSDGRRVGDITILKVLPDGTTIKVVALGVNALGFAGWPTTTAPAPNSGTPQPPAQQVEDLEDIAVKVAETLR